LAIFLFKKKREKTPVDVLKDQLLRRKKLSVSKCPSKEELEIIDQIKQKTNELNLNNTTRTKAYLDFYQEHPEIHWAFLAHMVSRNGGWSMTDLKGELLSRLLSKKQKEAFFSFIERGNWLIFHDAYTQLLLYEQSLKRGKPLYHLFPYFHISIFMETVWSFFWKNQDSALLTTALIINEQNYIEKRIIQNHKYKTEVFKTIEFELQDLLSFNLILFPYKEKGVLNLAGQTVNQFESLNQRILLGKKLYAILFKTDILKNVVEWAKSRPHTGSRKDYWPQIFNNVHEGIPGFNYQIKLSSCRLKLGARKIYSPLLENAWKEIDHEDAEVGEWFTDMNVLDHIKESHQAPDGRIEAEYCKTLERLELAAFAKKVISILD
jgi:hypothetical protein